MKFFRYSLRRIARRDTRPVRSAFNHSLRKRMDAEWEQKLIRTVRGVGYQLGTDSQAGREAAERGGKLIEGGNLFGSRVEGRNGRDSVLLLGAGTFHHISDGCHRGAVSSLVLGAVERLVCCAEE